MTDPDLFALCVYTEARGEPYEGKVAVGRVILNRMAAKWFSDGTIPGTVLRKDQFSAFYFDMVNGHYSRICDTVAAATAHAANLLVTAKHDKTWPDCQRACADAAPGSGYVAGPQWQALAAEPRAMLYCNPAISHPVWATADKHVATIYSHSFYRP